jgi:hypothetical protein
VSLIHNEDEDEDEDEEPYQFIKLPIANRSHTKP